MSRPFKPSVLAGLAATAGLFGCGSGSGYSTSSPAAAVGATAAVVALTGMNRALTGDCWARCSKGYACDRASGLCVQVECVPACGEGDECVARDREHVECVPRALAVPAVTPVTPSGPSAAPALNPPPANASSTSPGGSATFPAQR